MESTHQQIRKLIDQIEANKDNPNWLSYCAVQLSSLLFNLGEEMGEARFLEEKVVVGHLDIPNTEGKRMAVSEAEKRGIVQTEGAYDRLKINYQSVLEIIQSIKKRIDSQSQLLKSGI